MTKSGADLGREHARRLEEYIQGVEELPSRNGRPNMTAIARACGFDRQVLYKNPTCIELIEAALTEHGLDAIESSVSTKDQSGDWVPARKLREAEQRNSTLEKKVSELTARLIGLEAQLRRRQSVDDELVARGRRTVPPSAPGFERSDE